MMPNLFKLKLLFLIFLLLGCKDTPSSIKNESDQDITNFELEKLYDLSALSSRIEQEGKSDKVNRKYSDIMTELYLSGAMEKRPISVIYESKNLSFTDLYDSNDPLGWNIYLDKDGVITVEADVGLIVLESKNGSNGGRLIYDAVAYHGEKFASKNKFDYLKLGIEVLKKLEMCEREYQVWLSENGGNIQQ